MPVLSLLGYFWPFDMERYAFTDADRDRILEGVPSLMTILNENNDNWLELSFLQKKKMRFGLHAASLTDYCKADIIPRGLRIQKGPAMFRSDEQFCSKWMAILNKCAYDLMLLIIEHSMSTVASTTSDIDTLLDNLKSQAELEPFEEKLRQLQIDLDNFKKNMKETKLRKFERDRKDYKNARVYNWTYERKNRKRVTWGENSYSDIETTDEESTEASADEGPLRRRPPDRLTKQKAQENFFQLCPQRRGKRKL